MKAWVVRELGDPSVMRLEDIPDEPVADGMMRVRVEAAAINFGEILQVAGKYQVKPPFPFIPGWEFSGTVLEAPPESGFGAGDRVSAGVLNGPRSGSYAEVTDTHPLAAVRIPDYMSFEDAAGFTVAYQTAHFGLHRRGELRAGQTLLVHGGAGGVGSAAIQLGKAAGATVYATAGSDDKCELCRALGADVAINYKTEDFAERVNELTRNSGADVIYDPVGGDVFDRSTKCVAFEGRIIIVGFTSGRMADARTNHVMVKNYSVVGLHWGNYRFRNPALVDEVTQELFALYREGKIKPHISATYPLSEAPAALEAVGSGKTTGKVLLIPGS